MSTTENTALDAGTLKLIESVDAESRRLGRVALRRMVRTGQIRKRDLTHVAAVKIGYRKSIQFLTVNELIDMGIVTVVDDEFGETR